MSSLNDQRIHSARTINRKGCISNKLEYYGKCVKKEKTGMLM